MAIQAITLTPAKLLGLDDRIGLIANGYHADLVIWNHHPLEIGAHPLKVFVDGQETFEHPLFDAVPMPVTFKDSSSVPPQPAPPQQPSEFRNLENWVLHNISRIYAHENATYSGQGLTIVVQDGKISCIGAQCAFSKDLPSFDMHGGQVIPGMIAAYGRLGLEEIEAESRTHNGVSYDEEDGDRAVDGLRVSYSGSKQLQAAFKAGVTTAVAVPRGRGSIQGQPAAFQTSGENILGNVIRESTGFAYRLVFNPHVTLIWMGRDTKQRWAGNRGPRFPGKYLR